MGVCALAMGEGSVGIVYESVWTHGWKGLGDGCM